MFLRRGLTLAATLACLRAIQPDRMAAKKSADAWFAEYEQSHRHPTNELIHWICVPIIVASVLAFIWTIPVPLPWAEVVPWFNWALVAIVLTAFFYLRISPALSAGMLFFMSVCYLAVALLDLYAPWPVWKIAGVAFGLAWLGQFIGHRIEGRRPSFFQDLVFLLIGPAWLMSLLYKRVGQSY